MTDFPKYRKKEATNLIFRELDFYHYMCLSDARKDLTIIHGGANGVDSAASDWCLGVDSVEEIIYHPNWDKYGKAAGPMRNIQMLDLETPNLVLAFWDGISKGTKQMIDYAESKGYGVNVIFI